MGTMLVQRISGWVALRCPKCGNTWHGQDISAGAVYAAVMEAIDHVCGDQISNEIRTKWIEMDR